MQAASSQLTPCQLSERASSERGEGASAVPHTYLPLALVLPPASFLVSARVRHSDAGLVFHSLVQWRDCYRFSAVVPSPRPRPSGVAHAQSRAAGEGQLGRAPRRLRALRPPADRRPSQGHAGRGGSLHERSARERASGASTQPGQTDSNRSTLRQPDNPSLTQFLMHDVCVQMRIVSTRTRLARSVVLGRRAATARRLGWLRGVI